MPVEHTHPEQGPGRGERDLIDAARRQLARRAESPPGSSADATLDLVQNRRSGAASWAADALPGDIAGYDVLREIHRGGQGVVYLAVQKSTRRQVAIKVIRDAALASSGERARFEREVHILAQLRHPNIVAIHDSGRTEGRSFFVMDYVAGLPLDAHVAHLGLSRQAMLDLFVQVCDAVNAAHLRGVIHRDLKPGNIRVTPDGQPRVLDFGLAKTLDESSGGGDDAMTLTGQFIGSLPWVSPEQACGATVDVRTDVYSLGVILYQLLAGRFPYDVHCPMREALERIAHTEPLPPSSGSSGRVDSELDTISLKCLAKDAERRYQSAGELARDVRRYLAGEAIEAKRDSVAYVLRKQLRRHRLALGFAGALSVLIAGFGAWMSVLYARADHLRQVAEQRREEALRVAEFQAAQLSGIDVEVMGAQLRRAVLERHHAMFRDRGADHQALAGARETLEDALAGVNFTDIARSALDENIFDRALHAIDRQFETQPLVRAHLLQTLADTLSELGLLDRAAAPQTEALETFRQVLGAEHQTTLTSIANAGLLLSRQGKLAEAEPYFREALDGRRRSLGDDHPDTLSSLSNMGYLHSLQGRLAEAVPYFDEALTGRRRTLGADHPDTLTSMNEMGMLLKAQGRLADAEPYLTETLDGRRRVLGDDHPHTLVSINNLSYLLQPLGRIAEAAPLRHEALERRRRVLGNDHPDTLRSLNNMGALLLGQGKPAEAEPYYREALEGRRRVLGPEHPDTLVSIANMGAVLQAQGKLDEAEPYRREALDGNRRVLGENHPDTLTAINNMGFLLRAQGRLDEAEGYYRDALERRRRVLGAEHPDTLRSLNNVSALLLFQARPEQAEPLAREALESRRRALGDNHPDTLHSMNNLGQILDRLERFDEAAALYREALERYEARGGENPHQAICLHNLALTLGKKNDLDGALACARAALDLRRRIFGEKNAAVAQSLFALGELLRDHGRLDEAESHLIDALEMRRSLLGDDHPDVAAALITYADLLLDRTEADAAEPLLCEAMSILDRQPTAQPALTGAARGSLGRCLTTLERYTEADDELRLAHELLEDAVGTEHVQTREVIRARITLYDHIGDEHAAAELRALIHHSAESAPSDDP